MEKHKERALSSHTPDIDVLGKLDEYADEKIRQHKQKKGIVTDDQERIYVIYARKSTKGKTKNKKGETVERQEKSVDDQIKHSQEKAKQLGIKVIHIFREEESARKSGKRDAFTEMLRWIKQGRCNSIIAWHPDRLARNMREAGEVIDMLDRGEIYDLVFCTHTFIRDANGIMTLGFQFILAKQYSDNLSDVSSRGSESKALEGKAPTHAPKYGYKLNRSYEFVPDGKNFDILQKGFFMALHGMGQVKIAEYMNNANFEYQAKKKNVTKQMLSSIFQDSFYAGLYVYGKEKVWLKDVYPDDHPYKPMIDPESFYRLRSMSGNSHTFTAPSSNRFLLFRQLVTCGYCNKTMSTETTAGVGGRYMRVSCKNVDCPSKKLKAKRSIRAYSLLDFAGDKLLQGVEVSKEGYDDYLHEMNDTLAIQAQKLKEQYRIILSKLSRAENERDRLVKEGLPNAKTPTVQQQVNKQIEDILDDIKSLQEKESEVSQMLTDTDYALKHQVMSYETFSNYIKNLGNTIKTSQNLLEIDRITKMVFSNLIVKDEKVLSYALNPNFVRYLKPNCKLLSGRQDSNLRPHGPKPRALPTELRPEIQS